MEKMKQLDTILVFTADGCAACRDLVEDFRHRGVDFHEVNLSRQPGELETLRRYSWEHRLPVVVDHERVSIGFEGGSSSFKELGLE